MTRHIIATLAAAAMAAGALVSTAAVSASADPGSGRRMVCWYINQNDRTISDYDCFDGTIDIWSTYTGKKMLQLDGTCATYWNRHGKTNSWIDWNCQEWPNRNWQNGPGIPY